MYIGKTLFAQIMDFIPWTSFGRIVARYRGNARVRSLPCTEQFRVMAFAQMTWRESLRNIEACLSVQSAKLYHMGLRKAVARSTLADANESRDCRNGQISRKSSFAKRETCMLPSRLSWSSRTPSTLWTPQRSICVFRCSRGLTFVRRGPQ